MKNLELVKAIKENETGIKIFMNAYEEWKKRNNNKKVFITTTRVEELVNNDSIDYNDYDCPIFKDNEKATIYAIELDGVIYLTHNKKSRKQEDYIKFIKVNIDKEDRMFIERIYGDTTRILNK